LKSKLFLLEEEGCGGSMFVDVVAQCLWMWWLNFWGMWWLNVCGCGGSIFRDVMAQC